jgi:membrane peptidoglycan carboxypeptidase
MTTLDEDVLGPSLVVGGAYVNLLDITYGYSVFANLGVMRGVPTSLDLGPGNRELDPVSILQITRADGSLLYPEGEEGRVKVQEREVVDPRVAYGIVDILSDPNSHCITYGCGTLTIGRPWGVKTGTSEPFENSKAIGETWTFGFTPELVAGVWAGNADNAPMYNITSTSISYRALRDFMIEALKDTPQSKWTRPPGMKEVETCTPSGLLATPDCGRKVKQWLPADPEIKKDDWFKRARVDIRTGDLATELTPPQFISERFTFTIPDTVQGFARSQAEEWRRYVGARSQPAAGAPPTAEGLPVRIDTPRSGQYFDDGVIGITGKAQSDAFVSFRVEVGAGSAPSEWAQIANSTTPQPGGGLALWNIEDVPEGVYTIRLIVVDGNRGELQTFVSVNIGENIRTSPPPPPEPTPALDFDRDDDEDGD